MATIVRHKASGGRYILLGAGYGAWQAARPSLFFGNLIPSEQSGELSVIALCDENGKIGWAPSDDIEVVEVDGQSPDRLLS